MKKCSSCNELKTLNEFYNHKRSKDGKQPYCIKCFKLKYRSNKFTITNPINKNNLIEYYEDLIEFTNNRLNFSEGYDIMQNNGLRGFQLIPYLGFSVDTSSSNLGTFTGIKAKYNINTELSLASSYKQYISKPIDGGSNDTSDKKGYVSIYAEYNF